MSEPALILPASLEYGYVDARIILAVADTDDEDRLPNAMPASGTITLTPLNDKTVETEDEPVIVGRHSLTGTLDSTGRLRDSQGQRGLWVITGLYSVSYNLTGVSVGGHSVLVTSDHTENYPLHLATAAQPTSGPITPTEYQQLSARIDGIVVDAGGVTTVNGKTGTVVLSASDVDALPDSTPIPSTPADIGASPRATEELSPAQSLNDLMTPGNYMQPSSQGTTTALGYPVDGFKGEVLVTSSFGGTAAVQRATSLPDFWTEEFGMWVRSRESPTYWGPWNPVDLGYSFDRSDLDLNDLTQPGRYFVGIGTANQPQNVPGHVEVLSIPYGGNLTQRYTGVGAAGAGRVWSRTRVGSTWTAWKELVSGDDSRLTDARTPTSHTHAYADITDPPTIPAPQTLSLTGTDLTLSDGGGTVTLPSGGGGGNPWATLIRTPAVGEWITTPSVVSGGTDTGEIRSTNTMPLIVPTAMSIDAVAFKVGTAEAGATWTVDLLAADGTTLIATLGSAPLDTTGDKTITFAALALTPGGYFIRGSGHTWNVAKFAAARVNGWGSGVRTSPALSASLLPMADLHANAGHVPNVPLFYVRRSA